MAAMQEIETAVGKADAQAVAAPLAKPLVEHRPVEHDLVLGRERCGGQDAVAQFDERDRRGAALADDHRGGGIGGAHGGIERRAYRQQYRHHRGDRIAGARYVAHFDRIGRDVKRRMTGDMQRHAFLATGDQHRIALDQPRQLGRGLGDLGLRRHRPVHRRAQLLTVRRDQRGAAVDAVVVAFWIDHDRLAKPPCRVDDGAHDARGQHALGIIGQHDRAGRRHRRFGLGDDRGFARGARRLCRLPIRAQQMRRMVLGHEAHLARGVAPGIGDQMRNDRAVKLGEGIAQNPAGVVLADEADEDAARAERGDIAGDIAGAADLDLAALNRQHRSRRLRRYAGDFAIDEIVQHQIADAEHGLLGYELERFFEIEHVCCRRA